MMMYPVNAKTQKRLIERVAKCQKDLSLINELFDLKCKYETMFLSMIGYNYSIYETVYHKDDYKEPWSIFKSVTSGEYIIIAHVNIASHYLANNKLHANTINYGISSTLSKLPLDFKRVISPQDRSYTYTGSDLDKWLYDSIIYTLDVENIVTKKINSRIKSIEKYGGPKSSKSRLIKSLTWRVLSSGFTKEDLMSLLTIIKKYDVNKIETILGISSLSGFKHFSEEVIEEAVDRALISDILG